MNTPTTFERLEQLLFSKFSHYADRIATTDSREQLTYRELEAKSLRFAAMLQGYGLHPHEPVLVITENRGVDLAAFLGVWKAGGVVVPVHRHAADSTVEHILQLTDARFVLSGEGFPSFFSIGAEWKEAKELDLRLRTSIVPAHETDLEGAALVVFTSGTTGKAKGVILRHQGYIQKLYSVSETLSARDGMQTLLALQLTFSFGQWTSLCTLMHGGTIRLIPKFTPDIVSLLEHNSFDWFPVVPTMMRALLPHLEQRRLQRGEQVLRDWISPRIWMAGGEPLLASLGLTYRRLMPKCGVADAYGLTETNSADFVLRPDQYDQHAGSIGFCGKGISFRIVNAAGDECQQGEDGELEIRTPHVMRGYLRNPSATKAAFHDDFLRTGDVGFIDTHGAVRLTGRAKEIICKAGNKVSPLEVEEALLKLPEVAAAAVGAVPDELKGEVIGAVVVPRQGFTITAEIVTERLSSMIEKYKVPDKIRVASSVPLGSTGKTDRKAVRSLFS